MALAGPNRPVKYNGTTSWVTGDSLNQTDVEGDFTAILDQVDGNLDNDNVAAGAGIDGTKLAAGTITNTQISASAAILVSKLAQTAGQLDMDIVDDYAASSTEYGTVTDPGDSATISSPTNLEEEMERLRYVIGRAGVGVNAKITDGTAAAKWFDGTIHGGNVIKNGAFLDSEAESTGPTAPYGWSVVGTPTTLTSVSLGVTEGSGEAIHILDSGASGEGITQTLVGLKASSRYLIVARVKPITTDWKLTTTGATGTFGNLDLASASGGSAWETLAGVIDTDATPTDIVVNLIAASAASEAHIGCCFAFPLTDDPTDRIAAPVLVRSATSTSGTVATIEGDTTVGVVVPGPGYHISVDGIMVGGGTTQDLVITSNIEENVDGGGWSTAARAAHSDNSPGSSITSILSKSVMLDRATPTPGSLYQYRLTGTIITDSTSGFSFTPPGANYEHRIRVTLTKV